MLTGLFSGLGAALSQSLSYLATRHFYHNHRNPGRLLLVIGHLWMGILAALVVAWEWPRDAAGAPAWAWLGRVWLPAATMTACYLLGQVGMTLALKHVEPSRLSPLLGIKILFLALVSSFWPQPQYDTAAVSTVGLTWMQWAGVVLSVVAGVALNYAGAALRRRAVAAILLACLAFTFSDWNIGVANRALHLALPDAGIVQVSLLNAGLCYILAALPALLAAPFWGSRQGRDWLDAAPFAFLWFAGMVLLYWCMAEVGPLLGAILQSTRGVMSILLGSLLVYRGHLNMEPRAPRHVLLQRLAAGMLMFLAVTLYVIRDPRNLRIGW